VQEIHLKRHRICELGLVGAARSHVRLNRRALRKEIAARRGQKQRSAPSRERRPDPLLRLIGDHRTKRQPPVRSRHLSAAASARDGAARLRKYA